MHTLWKFTETFDYSRRQRLEAVNSFEEIVSSLLTQSKIHSARLCKANDLGVENCWRPIVVLKVQEDLFDAFFNGANGYRAQYLKSPEAGQSANNLLLQTLEPRLTDAVIAECGTSILRSNWIRNSFLANSAKSWIDEGALNFLEVSHDLDIDPWYQNRGEVNSASGSGLWAPRGTLLKVIGAFIDSSGNEIVSQRKICRRIEIHRCGFS